MPELSSHGTVSNMRCVLQRPKGYAQAHKPKPVTPPVFAGTNTTAPTRNPRRSLARGLKRVVADGGSTLLIRRSTRAAGSGERSRSAPISLVTFRDLNV